MNDDKPTILVLVEGEKTDVKLMEHLFRIYGFDSKHQIVSYKTDIYTLYNAAFKDPDSFDLVLHLREQERKNSSSTASILDEWYPEVILIFDLDPHATHFSDKQICEMLKFFDESTEMGKLYINYPMVEAFYHMKNIPDLEYNTYTVSIVELKSRSYKARVNKENRNHDYSKFAIDKAECDMVIWQNIEKARLITGLDSGIDIPDHEDILEAQLQKLKNEQVVAVLCTCIFRIVEYDPKAIDLNCFLEQTQKSE